MAPTLLGACRTATCSACGLAWPIDVGSADYGTCWHCGDPVRADGLKPGQLVDVVPATEIVRGQLVALETDDAASVKRVVAVPGDRINLRGLELLVNDQPIVTQTTLPVDLDDHRGVTRWLPDRRTDDRHWKLAANDNEWLTYHHTSVHDQNRPSPVWDDYSVNFNLSRPLEPVERLIVRGEVIAASDDASVQVADHSGKSAIVPLRTGEALEAIPMETVSALPTFAPEQPVAIRLRSGTATVAKLSIHRRILYRLRRRDDASMYPLTLGHDQCFILGDNVPVSIDSRNHGPITLSQIIGTVGGTYRISSGSDRTS